MRRLVKIAGLIAFSVSLAPIAFARTPAVATARFAGDRLLSARIGARLYTADHTAVGIIDDILFDHTGAATTVLLQDGGYFGAADSRVALPYLSVFIADPAGDRLRPATPLLKRLARPAGTTADALSAQALLRAGIAAADGQRLADIQDLTLQNDHLGLALFTYGTQGGPGRLVGVPLQQLTQRDSGDAVIFVLNKVQEQALKP